MDQNWTYVEVPSDTVREAFETAKEDFVGGNKVYLYVWVSPDDGSSNSNGSGDSSSNSSNSSNSSSSNSNSSSSSLQQDLALKVELD